MKSFAFAATMAAANALSTLEFDYMNYMAQYNKMTNDVSEFNARLSNFAETDAFIKENNASGETHVAGHNQFSDWHYSEYKQMLGYRSRGTKDASNIKIFPETNADSVNWVTAGAVTKVKDQGQCGSCWSFSTTGAMEGAHYIASGELLSFSEQQLVDCDAGLTKNHGCNGGNPLLAYRYYKSNAAELEEVYPYTSGTGDDSTDCLFDASSTTAVEVSSYAQVAQDDKDQMKAALAQQPLAVLIEADKMVFQTYKSGVLDSDKCGTKLDHAVLAVGYGTEDGQDYWLVKNSWNTTWGDEGYIKLGMDDSDGTCGVQIDPNQPTTN